MIAFGELEPRVADEFIAIQVRDDRRVQLAVRKQVAQIGKPIRQHVEQLPERVRLDIKVSHTSSLARNTEEFDVHAGL